MLLFEPSQRYQGKISQIITGCNARVLVLPGDSLGAARRLASGCQAALVALPDEGSSAVLDMIRVMSQNGVAVFAFGEGLDAWPVHAQCLPLLAGAKQLFDNSHAEFEVRLHDALSHTLEAFSKRAEEEKEIRTRMAAIGIAGKSPAIVRLFKLLVRVSTMSDLPVLVTGETGTGKDVFVRALHQLDAKRRQGRFVAVNCAAVAANLAESEFFGHRRGAFTGAERERLGWLRAAEGGVLFLDEIGEMDLGLQAKLLRALQENRVLSVGEDQERKINVRVVAATNRDLIQMVEQGTFRADLLHRLNVLSLHIPPLRERREDIDCLVHLFLQRRGYGAQCERLEVTSGVLEAFRQLELPGNARELENLIQKALINKPSGGPLAISDLPVEIWEKLCARGISGQQPQLSASERCRTVTEVGGKAEQWSQLLQEHGGKLSQSVACCEKALLQAALQRTRGNQSKTARLLGITARTIHNKMRKYHLSA